MVLFGIVTSLSAIGASPAFPLSDPDDFCTGDPCNITSNKTVDAGVTLDFGTRDVNLTAILTMANGPGGGPTFLNIVARSFTITGLGQIDGNGTTSQSGGDITSQTTGDIVLNGTRDSGTVRVVGYDAGSVILDSTAGNVTATGKINLDHNGFDSYGGTLIVSAADVAISGKIIAVGGGQGGGGSVDVTATGNVNMSGDTDLGGGEGGGGDYDVYADGNITIGEVNLDGGGDIGDGGAGDISAGGDLLIAGDLIGRGSGAGFEMCGDGSDLDAAAGGTVTVTGTIDLRSRAGDCAGGALTIEGFEVQMNNDIILSGVGDEGEGGSLDVFADDLLSLTGTAKLDGQLSGGGDVLLLSDGDIDIPGNILAYGRNLNSPGAILIEIDTDGILSVSGTIDGSGGNLSDGGDVSLSACDVNVTATAAILSNGLVGSIDVFASDTLTLAGMYEVDPATGSMDVTWGTRADPPNIGAAVFNVAPSLVLDPLLAPCRFCDTAAECDDSNLCTDDVCVPATGCSNPPNSNPCNDGDACTTDDTCTGGACTGGSSLVCDDGNECTDDSCNPASGCEATPNTDPCDDGDACTDSDVCSGNVCSGVVIDCEDGNPCTDNACLAGLCTTSNNTDPCDDGDACTENDSCSAGGCVAGPPPNCSDSDVCTDDLCDSLTGCFNDPIPGCIDTDNDGTLDDEDACTTIDWSPIPTKPPDQNPRRFRLSLKKLARPAGEQSVLLKGLFNPASPPLPIDPSTKGMFVRVEDAGGLLYEVNIPGGLVGTSPCGTRDGWAVGGKASAPIYKYKNKSGAFPPGCAPGSAKGVFRAFVKDRRTTGSASLLVGVKAKRTTLDDQPTVPLTHVQAIVSLAAEPSPGVASAEAIAGQCAEAIFTGNPISASSPKPFCKVKQVGTSVDKVDCKGS